MIGGLDNEEPNFLKVIQGFCFAADLPSRAFTTLLTPTP